MAMSTLKSILRDALPASLQVPVKFYLDKWRGYHEPEMALLPYLVGKGDRVIDVGGNRGAYSFQLEALGARVEVFDPNPACCKVLAAWARHHPSVQVHPVGLSDQHDSTELLIPIDENGVEHDSSASLEPHLFRRSRAQAVELRTLDSYLFKDVRFIKIDVEGHESKVVKGASQLLADCRPALLVEIEQRHLSRPMGEVFSLILDMGYEGWFLDGSAIKQLARFDPITDQSDDAQTSREARRYINNFLFLARERAGAGQYERMFAALGGA